MEIIRALWLTSVGDVDDMVDLAMGTDVLKRVMRDMKEFDPSFALPEGFFPGNTPTKEDEAELKAAGIAQEVEGSNKPNEKARADEEASTLMKLKQVLKGMGVLKWMGL